MDMTIGGNERDRKSGNVVYRVSDSEFERRARRLLAESAEASRHVSSTPDSQAMTRCPLAIIKIIKNRTGLVA